MTDRLAGVADVMSVYPALPRKPALLLARLAQSPGRVVTWTDLAMAAEDATDFESDGAVVRDGAWKRLRVLNRRHGYGIKVALHKGVGLRLLAAPGLIDAR